MKWDVFIIETEGRFKVEAPYYVTSEGIGLFKGGVGRIICSVPADKVIVRPADDT